MATTEATIPDHHDFEYDHRILRYQRQTCLLQLYSKCGISSKQREAGVMRTEVYNMHKSVLWLLDLSWMINKKCTQIFLTFMAGSFGYTSGIQRGSFKAQVTCFSSCGASVNPDS
ncbi:uncharacterized protein LOC144058034 isoform X2 [Vanacampus margaritifer]